MAMGAGIEMTRELSTEWASRGGRVSTILPAQVWNGALRERIARTPESEDTFLGGIPMDRLGNAEEIKGPAIFQASDTSGFVTGAILPVDGEPDHECRRNLSRQPQGVRVRVSGVIEGDRKINFRNRRSRSSRNSAASAVAPA